MFCFNFTKSIQFLVVFLFLAECSKVKTLPFPWEAMLSDVVAGGLTLSVMALVSRRSSPTGRRMFPCPLLWVPSACLGKARRHYTGGFQRDGLLIPLFINEVVELDG